MPIYEYQCGSCKHIFDELQKISDDPLKDCPECKEGQLKKLVSAPKFRLKGAGWYETDFKTGTKRNIAEGSSSDTKKAGSSDVKKASSSE